MPRQDAEVRVTPSVLDRLIDMEPGVSTEAPKSRSTSMRELKQAVRRDLEWLLNTRAPDLDVAEDAEVRHSVACYGLPDIMSMSPTNPAEQRRLIKALEQTIEYFEPRFLHPRIILEPMNEAERSLRFRIEASLDIEPTPEPVVFDTVLQSGSGEFEVKER
ncbi:MAG: type VI secretion system baseplate subunit TssE [Chloracidobacterium sp.]|nr:type VI secretion system baseplate subunit TssE [Chloracidobacterium sp.]MCO5332958.1 type VI secretion system baseplate subunit TssE [Pyrinomonadaceae bacterium]